MGVFVGVWPREIGISCHQEVRTFRILPTKMPQQCLNKMLRPISITETRWEFDWNWITRPTIDGKHVHGIPEIHSMHWSFVVGKPGKHFFLGLADFSRYCSPCGDGTAWFRICVEFNLGAVPQRLSGLWEKKTSVWGFEAWVSKYSLKSENDDPLRESIMAVENVLWMEVLIISNI